MLILTAAQVRDWDQFTIANEPIDSIDLMERAATACCDWLQDNGYLQRPFAIFCGSGNNGGDGLAIARMLTTSGADVIAYVLNAEKGYSPDCSTNLGRAEAAGVPLRFIDTPDAIPRSFTIGTVIIDALFGTGLHQPLSGTAALLVAVMNSSGCEIISVDLPSGLHADGPSSPDQRIHADHTLTFQALKTGLLLTENAQSFGEVHVLDIGLHPTFLLHIEQRFQWLDRNVIKGIYRPRNKFSHKGDHGHAALITGSIGLMGAATLCASGCMRSGAGKLTCYIPRIGYDIMQMAVPEAMAAVSGEEYITQYQPVFGHEAIGMGPGIGFHFKAKLLKQILEDASSPLLLDADALTLLSQHPEFFKLLPPDSVLTPHPKEFDRMFGVQANDFERIETCLEKARELKVVIVLKGHHTLVALPDGKAWFNSTGNAGMATGGSGDVLAGIITGLMAQGYQPAEAAMFGVYLHGLAGDLAAKELSKEGMIAGDLVKYLPKAFQYISLRS